MLVSDVKLEAGDLSRGLFERALQSEIIAWDIETSGLDWRKSRMGTCQIATPDDIVVVQLDPGRVPERLAALLESTEVEKVFHHAMFDLRFMAWAWDVVPANVACTKILCKILEPELPSGEHSLLPTLSRHLGVVISKDEQRSDWTTAELRPEQIQYAAADVQHLTSLFEKLRADALAAGVWPLVSASFEYLPARVKLDLVDVGDVFVY